MASKLGSLPFFFNKLDEKNNSPGREIVQVLKKIGEPRAARTLDPRLKRAMLYQLS